MDSPHIAESADVRASVKAPPVEVVVVAHDPGPWFSESLSSLAAQDYPRLHVTVLATEASTAIAQQVRLALPNSAVAPLDHQDGYGKSLNVMLANEARPAFYLFCHDDVALAPDAVRLLVEEALRSNASVVGPKHVRWDRPEELLEVGLDVDKLGYVAPRVEVGELDQEQHDAVTDVFAISGAAQLVRADLFHALEGFDDVMGVTGEDVDFCWRAHVAGARVVVAPSAVARHRAGMGERKTEAEIQRLGDRHRLRTLLSVYGLVHSARVLPQALIYSVIRIVGAVITGQFATARAGVSAWRWNLARPGSLLRRRSLIRSVRKIPDSEIRRLQVGGFAPVSQFLRGTFSEDGGGSIAARTRNILRTLRTGPSRLSLGFWAITIVMLVFGSRHLITRQVPVVGDLVPFDLGPSDLFGLWFDSWWTTGTGHEAAAPTAFGLTGVLGIVFFGSMGLLRMVLTVGMLPIGAVGMWRFLRPFSSPWIRVVGTMMYLASPLPYNALTNGSWGGLLLFGLLPWLVAGLGRAARIAPFGRLGGAVGEGVLEPAWNREVLAIALPLAALVAFVPFAMVMLLGVVLALMVGSLFAGWPGGTVRMFGVATGAALVAAVLNLPWLLDALSAGPSWDWFAGTRPATPDAIDLEALLRLDTGRIGGAPLGWALPLAALVPLLLARGPRWAWAVRGLCMYLAAVGAVWATGQGWVPQSVPRPEILLAPAAFGLALAVAMGVAAIERDLRTYKFGWRQFAPVTAVVAVVLAMVPATVASFNGAWRMPDTEFNRQFAQQGAPDSPQRVLWIGHDDVLAAGGRVGPDQLTVAVTSQRETSFVDRWAGTPEPADPLVSEAIELALSGGTSRLGRLLAPLGIGEIIVVERLAPPPAVGLSQAVPKALLAALADQLDLAELEVGPGLTRYRNTSALAAVAVVPSGTTSGRSLRQFAASSGELPGTAFEAVDGGREFVGSVDVGQEVYAAFPADSAWRLSVGDQIASKSPALEWAVAFTPAASGEAVLVHRTSGLHRMIMSGQAALWVLAVGSVLRLTSRSGASSRRERQ